MPAEGALHRFVTADPVLPSFRRQRSPLNKLGAYSTAFAVFVLIGLFYGFSVALLPPSIAIYLVLPIGVLSLLVIWALPDLGYAPTRLLVRLFGIYILVIVLWPKYLAFQVSGLPWVSLRRIFGYSLFLTFLICCSTSRPFREEIKSALASSRLLTLLIGVFTANQIFTLALSETPATSLQDLIDYILLYTTIAIVGAWALAQRDVAETTIKRLLIACLIISVIGLLEWRNGLVLWANHIPSFLAIDPAALESYLSPAMRGGEYRVITTFANSLVMSEFLALMTPFVIHFGLKNPKLSNLVLWGAIDLGILGTINLTQSRLGILGWSIAHAVTICLWAFRRWGRLRSDLVAPTLSLLYPIGAAIVFVGMFTIPAIRNRTIGGGSTGYSDNSRKEQFALLWPKLWANPFGYGTSRSGKTLQYHVPSGKLTTDSYVITVLLDYGVLGFLLYFSFFIICFVAMVKLYWKRDDAQVDLALPLASALLVAIQIRLVLSQVDNMPLLYMLFGLTMALTWRASRKVGEAVPGLTPLAKPAA